MTYQTLQTLSQIAIATGLVIAALGGYGAYYFGKQIESQEKKKAAYEGKLNPVPKIIFSSRDKIYPEMEIGNSGSVLVWKGPTGEPIFKFDEDNYLLITNDKTGIKVSIRIYNKNNKVAAELIQNEWKVNPNNTWDRNYSKNALEVKDDSGDIILQVV